MNHDGTVDLPLEPTEIDRIVAVLRDLRVDAVAVSLLHSYANDTHERMLGEAVSAAMPDTFVTLSSDVCPEFREFERTSTAVVNSYLGPTVSRYLASMSGELTGRGVPSLSIVKSNGGLTSAANARRFPAHLIESGPAAGVIAAAALGDAEGYRDLIAFDMGGTTAKVGVIREGKPRLTTEFYADRFVDGVDVGGYPIKSPVIDIIEIGAGGGSIARVDSAGVLKVGPESAGALPGPACYGLGGDRATITDAHVALGNIATDGFGSEDLKIHPDRARSAIERDLAAPLGWSLERAAWGILTIATANMAEIVRLATLRRGLDPRDFTLIAFGGAGPLHVVDIAREVGVPQVIIPPYPGLFSAIGTVLGDVRHDLVQTLMRLTSEIAPAEIAAAIASLEQRARDLIAKEDVGAEAVWLFDRSVDLRFEGQLFELTLPVSDEAPISAESLEEAFRSLYLETYGYDLESHVVELVSVRLAVRTSVWEGGWPKVANSTVEAQSAARTRSIVDSDGIARETTVIRRAALEPGDELKGPMIIEDFGATIRVLDGQTVDVRPSGILVISG